MNQCLSIQYFNCNVGLLPAFILTVAESKQAVAHYIEMKAINRETNKVPVMSPCGWNLDSISLKCRLGYLCIWSL